MQSRQIEAFRAIAHTGTVTGAASALHISQPAVSRLLAHLEMRLQFELFERQRGRLRLTPEGDAFLREVDKHFVGLDALTEAGRRIATQGPGTLRVLGIPSITSGSAPVVAAKMLSRQPKLAIAIDTDTTDRIAERVSVDRYDLGFATAPVVTRGAVNAEILASRPWVCVFPSGHKFANSEEVDAAALASEPLVGFSPGMSLRDRVQQEFAAIGVTPNFTVAGQTVETLCRLASAGVAGAVIHPYAEHVAAMHGLNATRINGLSALDLVLVTPALARPSLIAQEFVDGMRRSFQ